MNAVLDSGGISKTSGELIEELSKVAEISDEPKKFILGARLRYISLIADSIGMCYRINDGREGEDITNDFNYLYQVSEAKNVSIIIQDLNAQVSLAIPKVRQVWKTIIQSCFDCNLTLQLNIDGEARDYLCMGDTCYYISGDVLQVFPRNEIMDRLEEVGAKL